MRLTPGLDEEVIARTAAQVELTASLQLTLDHLAIFDTQLQVSLAKVSGDLPGAIELAREADRLEGLMPYSFGPPTVTYPSAELLGEFERRLFDIVETATETPTS